MPFEQAAIIGVLFLVVYGGYAYFIAGMEIMKAFETSLYSAILFMCVYYFVTIIIIRKSAVETTRSKAKGPKGRRKF